IGGPRHLHPTSETPMHLEAYRQRPDIQAVVHAHPPYAVALSIAGISMADCLLPEAIVFLGTIPTTAYATPSSQENAQVVRDLIGNHDGLVLQRHGSLTVGNSPTQAFMRLETLERNAFIGYLLATLGIHSPMPPHEVQKLLNMRQTMGLSHPGETDEFCERCGVCHPEGNHSPHTRKNGTMNEAAIRDIVAEVVEKTLGGRS
ncbi:MAG: class II aldolase/adducin family protein, partial [Chloroflexi bacterium]|nr:class II aldolase/adducin family protein [Chloroflexota bacterium]